jgi:uncharacterized membrane protein YphA (DoxX/SURF4 family)
MSGNIKDLVFGVLFLVMGWHFLNSGLRNWSSAQSRPQFRYMTKATTVFTGAMCAVAGVLILGGLVWRTVLL